MVSSERFGVTTTIFVHAADADEAALIVERLLAGRFDSDLVAVVDAEGATDDRDEALLLVP